jgi:putative PIN family toxin of toxin-antitoxin system
MSYRVVLDTNCVVSALLFSQQKMAWLRHGWQSGHFVPLVNKQTVRELLRVLTYPKFKLTKAEQALLLADFLPYAETVPLLDAPVDLPTIRDSAADQKFLTLAVVGKANALITGDSDLLAIKNSFKLLPILKLGEFEEWLKARKK